MANTAKATDKVADELERRSDVRSSRLERWVVISAFVISLFTGGGTFVYAFTTRANEIQAMNTAHANESKSTDEKHDMRITGVEKKVEKMGATLDHNNRMLVRLHTLAELRAKPE